ncbi:hypothetical protein GC176_04840 [bacterium]|nr:hypothetical protein [bacterium]
MKRFRKILVGVDLCSESGAICAELSASTRSAIEKARWVAGHTSASVTFCASLMSCLDLNADARHLAEMQRYTELLDAMYEQAEQRLATLTDETRQAGIDTNWIQTTGTPWMELLREAVFGNYDLVLVGSHRRHVLGRVLLGNTGRRLLRKCPCPVWVTSPVEDGMVRRILVPTDFSPTADEAVRLGDQLAQQLQAELHILHVIEYHYESELRDLIIPVNDLEQYRSKVHADAERELNDTLTRLQLDSSIDSGRRHIAAGSPHQLIHNTVDKLSIDLVVMGTQARSGISGILLGNTAERVLAHLTCSVLAIKPEGFVCPVEFPAASDSQETPSV